MIEGQTANFVKRYQDLDQELLMLSLQWQCEAINDAPEDLEQLSNAVEVLSFVDESRAKK